MADLSDTICVARNGRNRVHASMKTSTCSVKATVRPVIRQQADYKAEGLARPAVLSDMDQCRQERPRWNIRTMLKFNS